MNLEQLVPFAIPSFVRSLLLPAALGLGIAVLLYAGISSALGMSADAPTAVPSEDLAASEVVRRFATALVVGDKEAMARYATAEFAEKAYPPAFDKEGPAEDVARSIRQHVAENGLVQVSIERMAPQDGRMRVDVMVRMFDSAHFARWTEHDTTYSQALDEAVAAKARELAGDDTTLRVTDRAGNLLAIAAAGQEAFASVQQEMSSITQSYVNRFFRAVGPDAQYMMEPLPPVSLFLEHRSGRWVVVSSE